MNEYPTREMLIIGAANLALGYLLHELRKEKDSANEVKRVMSAVQIGAKVLTSNIAIKDCLAHAQQTLRVSHDEWERTIKVTHTRNAND